MSADVLLSGLFGAVLVFFLSWWREWWRADRERRGLARLLLSEIKHNSTVTEIIQDSGISLFFSPDLPRMRTETWRESRESAVALPSKMLKDLDDYYRPLEILLTLREFPDMENDRLERIHRKILGQLSGREFVRSQDHWGESEQAMLEAQDRARQRLTEYWESSWWQRWFGE